MDAIQKAIKEIELAIYYMTARDVLRDHRVRLMEALAALREYRDENARLLPVIDGLEEAINDHACAGDAILGKHIDVLAKAAREYKLRTKP